MFEMINYTSTLISWVFHVREKRKLREVSSAPSNEAQVLGA